MKHSQYYSIEEVSKTLKVAYLTVYRWVRAEKLIAVKAGKQYRIKRENLDIFLKNKDSK
ncbi:MAG: helix-turn-helix domain-containing protein [Candidatus Roizmanbacteria bacterium]|nr:helix-turn-helix domain-containing protein [Candidatus Roizmanbacteria bacterium]